MKKMKTKTSFNVGDTVTKKSGKPFKNGSTYQTIVEFGINEQDPNQRPCAIFSDGSVCNLDMLNRMVFFDIETSGFGIPTGHLSMISGVSKVGKSELVKFLFDREKSEYTVVMEDIGNMDTITLEQAGNVITRMLEVLKDNGVDTDELHQNTDSVGFDMQFLKSRTVEEKIGNTVFPVTYFNDGMVIVDYPIKL
jgi:hypothetical protein